MTTNPGKATISAESKQIREEQDGTMRLCDCAAGKLYMIRTVTAEETIVRRLEALGLVEGTKVHILMKKQDGSLIAAFQGTRLALGKKIAGAIEAEDCEEHGR